MALNAKSSILALGAALILAGPAYWAGYHAAIYLLRQETMEYKVWQESYYVDRRFFEAISKNPPPRYQVPRPWEGHLGGALAVVFMAALAFSVTMALVRNKPPRETQPSSRSFPDS